MPPLSDSALAKDWESLATYAITLPLCHEAGSELPFRLNEDWVWGAVVQPPGYVVAGLERHRVIERIGKPRHAHDYVAFALRGRVQ